MESSDLDRGIDVRDRRSRWALAGAVGLASVVVGCSDDSNADSERQSTEAQAAVCADWRAVRGSLEGLGDMDVVDAGASGLVDALDGVLDDLDALSVSASDRIRAEVESLDEAVEVWRSAIEDPSLAATAAALNALGVLMSTTDEVLEECGT